MHLLDTLQVLMNSNSPKLISNWHNPQPTQSLGRYILFISAFGWCMQSLVKSVHIFTSTFWISFILQFFTLKLYTITGIANVSIASVACISLYQIIYATPSHLFSTTCRFKLFNLCYCWVKYVCWKRTFLLFSYPKLCFMPSLNFFSQLSLGPQVNCYF